MATQRAREPEGPLGPITFHHLDAQDMDSLRRCAACGAVVTTPATKHQEFHRLLDPLLRRGGS